NTTLDTDNGGGIYNQSTGTIEDNRSGAVTFGHSGAVDTFFVNRGTYLKTGAGDTTFWTDFTNETNSLFSVQAGKVVLRGNTHLTGGSLVLNSSKPLELRGATTLDADILSGTGAVQFLGSSSTLSGTLNLGGISQVFNGSITGEFAVASRLNLNASTATFADSHEL